LSEISSGMKSGIYLHIPFCRSKCNYCNFISRPWDKSLGARYWRAVVRELEAYVDPAVEIPPVDSIYLGGGTPSLLPSAHVEGMLTACRNRFAIVPDCEISMEANPGTLTREKLSRCLSAGVNRVSMGAQSFWDDELAAICRIHKADQIVTSCCLLREAGLRNFSLDLMLGLPGQTEARWRASLHAAIAMEPSHLSFYMLELSSKTPLFGLVESGKCRLPDDDAVADWYLIGIDILESHGYEQYEISNFARPGCQCRHNLKYWRREPVLGFGVAAHSHDVATRYANSSDLDEYLESVEAGRSAVRWREPVSDVRALEETMYLGLRLVSGLDWRKVRAEFSSVDVAACASRLRELADAGLLEWQDARVRLTRRGMLLSNEVFQNFVRLGENGKS
jgi:oxygen-independent coproporphyrinogen-3 oxidase